MERERKDRKEEEMRRTVRMRLIAREGEREREGGEEK